jgi:magnesium-transporting ATPase (P-type)
LKLKDDNENKNLKQMKQQLESWSVNGLRTLVFAKREIKK